LAENEVKEYLKAAMRERNLSIEPVKLSREKKVPVASFAGPIKLLLFHNFSKL
jgi:hypothetical protein